MWMLYLIVFMIGNKQFLEAAPRFELGVEVLQTSALPLGYAALLKSTYCKIKQAKAQC